MKKTKKLLAFLIAIIMIVSTMPVAFAQEECEHGFYNFTGERPNLKEDGYCYCYKCGAKSINFTEVIDVLIDGMGIVFSSYGTEEAFREAIYVWDVVNSYVYGGSRYEELGYYIADLTEEDQSLADEIVGKLKGIISDFEAKNYPVIYDAEEMMYWYFWGFMARNYGSDILVLDDSAFEEYEEAYMYFVNRDIYEFFLADAEETAEKGELLIHMFKIVANCRSGNHTFGEYTDNGDGTKTADCEYCNTVDTVEAEKKDIIDIVSTDLVELIKMLFTLVKSFIETVFA